MYENSIRFDINDDSLLIQLECLINSKNIGIQCSWRLNMKINTKHLKDLKCKVIIINIYYVYSQLTKHHFPVCVYFRKNSNNKIDSEWNNNNFIMFMKQKQNQVNILQLWKFIYFFKFLFFLVDRIRKKMNFVSPNITFHTYL